MRASSEEKQEQHQKNPSGGELALADEDRRTDSQRLVAWYVDESRRRNVEPPKRTVGHVAREVNALLKEGREPREIALGLKTMLDKRRVQPQLLPQFVMEAQLPHRTRSTPEHLTPEAMLLDAQRTREEEER